MVEGVQQGPVLVGTFFNCPRSKIKLKPWRKRKPVCKT